ncbi:BON domain-containing protein [Rhizobium sp. RAF56]|jgi:hypothetical protein|uniref:BON domain-containing protein n=1 Tax=Rhizobium sp. RAF56 TaxID=3233062 RepID=UPI003F99F141
MDPKDKELSREEDYRDYEERDIEEGWPYDDAAGERSAKKANPSYGEGANFDSQTNKGYRVTDADESGNEERQADGLLPGTSGREEDDDLEERVMDALLQSDDTQPEQIDVRVEGSTVTLEGDVDGAEAAHRLVSLARGVKGVGRIHNNLRVLGADANIPDED